MGNASPATALREARAACVCVTHPSLADGAFAVRQLRTAQLTELRWFSPTFNKRPRVTPGPTKMAPEKVVWIYIFAINPTFA